MSQLAFFFLEKNVEKQHAVTEKKRKRRGAGAIMDSKTAGMQVHRENTHFKSTQ